MSSPFTHLTEIQLALVASSIVAKFQVIRAWSHTDDGYIRIRATLINGDFLEAAEYFMPKIWGLVKKIVPRFGIGENNRIT